jgi:hypothetical protein
VLILIFAAAILAVVHEGVDAAVVLVGEDIHQLVLMRQTHLRNAPHGARRARSTISLASSTSIASCRCQLVFNE